MRALVALMLILAVPTFAAADPGDCEGVHAHTQGETLHCGAPVHGSCNTGVVGNTNETVDRPCDTNLCQNDHFPSIGGMWCSESHGPQNTTRRETLIMLTLGDSQDPIPSGNLFLYCAEVQSDVGSSSACHLEWEQHDGFGPGTLEAGENVPYPFATP